MGKKWIDINTGEGELKVHQFKMGILRDDVFSATPPLEAVWLLMSLMMAERKPSRTNSCSLTSAELTSIRHAEDECLWSCLQNWRGQFGVVC